MQNLDEAEIIAEIKESVLMRLWVYFGCFLVLFFIVPISGLLYTIILVTLAVGMLETWPHRVSITKNGITFTTIFGRTFVAWHRVRDVSKGFAQTYVFVQGLPILPRFQIIGWHRNYKEFVKLLRENAGG